MATSLTFREEKRRGPWWLARGGPLWPSFTLEWLRCEVSIRLVCLDEVPASCCSRLLTHLRHASSRARNWQQGEGVHNFMDLC